MTDIALTTVNLLLEGEVGTAVWEWATLNQTDEELPMFLLKVFPGEAQEIVPFICIKAITLAPKLLAEPVGLVVVVFSIGHSEYLYEFWINHHSIEQVSPLEKLAKMPTLRFAIYEESTNPERIISISNSLDWETALKAINQYQPWSMEAFTEAKKNCCQTYTKEQLWQLDS